MSLSRMFRQCFLLLVLCGSHVHATPPGFHEFVKAGTPPSAQVFRQWTAKQATFAALSQGAAGGMLSAEPVTEPVRIPFVVVTLSDTPTDMLNDKGRLLQDIRKSLFDSGAQEDESLQSYYNHLFKGKMAFLNTEDVLEVTLNGSSADYLTSSNGHPRRVFLEDLAIALSHQSRPLVPYNNSGLKHIEADPLQKDALPEIDLAVIIVMTDALDAEGGVLLWPQRSWAEWTTASGFKPANPQPPLLIQGPATADKKLKLSNYCILPVRQKTGARGVFGSGFLAHEILHAFGLPDLYDRSAASGGCGGWCCLSWGMYAGLEQQPASTFGIPFDTRAVWPSAWCRSFLQLGSVQMPIAAEGDANIVSPLRDGFTAMRLDFPPDENAVSKQPPCDHYLLVELRGPKMAKAGKYDWDNCFPESGFLIWEVRNVVGQQDPLTGGKNIYWPCTYIRRPGIPSQNDQDEPLVGLCRPGALSGSNLATTELLHPTHVWKSGAGPFVHPEGITLSDFKVSGYRGSFHYKYQDGLVHFGGSTAQVNATPSEAAAASAPPPRVTVSPERRSAAEPSTTFPRDVSVKPHPGFTELRGTVDELKTMLPEAKKSLFAPMFKAYPELEHSIVTDGQSNYWPALPVETTNKKIFAAETAKNMSWAISGVLGDSRATPITIKNGAAVASNAKDLEKFYSSTDNTTKLVGVRIGGELFRVADSFICLEREGTERDIVRFSATQPVSFIDLPASTEFIVPKDKAKAFLATQFPKLSTANAQWEIVIDSTSGKPKWTCRLPTVPSSGPVTIEFDAMPPQGEYSATTAINVK